MSTHCEKHVLTPADNFDSIVNGGYEKEDMVADRWTDIIRELVTKKFDPTKPAEAEAMRQLADFKKMESIRARADEVVKDKATAEALKPWYNQFCKRPCFHDEYLDTFNRPNVKLVDTNGQGVERITEKGVVANGVEYEIDCLIYATGFEIAQDWSYKTGMEIYGRDGMTTTKKYKDGASTLHGWASRQFPNCFWVSIVQAALTPNFMHVTAEQARHFAYVISEMQKRDIKTVEPTQEAEDAWCDTIVKGTAIRGDFFKECTPGYYNSEGKPTMSAARNATYAFGSPAFIKILTDWRNENKLAGLDIVYNSKDGEQPAAVDGDSSSTETSKQLTPESTKLDTPATSPEDSQTETPPTLREEMLAPRGEERTLIQQYSDLQAKHQAEMNDLLNQQRGEVERLLAKQIKGHAKKDSGVEGI